MSVMNCEQLAQYDEEIPEKDALIAQLRARGIFLEVDPEESVDSPGGSESAEDDDLAAIIEDLKTALAQATDENNQLKDELSQQQLESEVVKTALEEKVRTLEQEKESLREATSSSGVEELKDELKREKEKVKNVWHMNCELTSNLRV